MRGFWRSNASGRARAVISASDRPASASVAGPETRAYIVGMPLIDIVPAALSDQELLSEVSRRAASEREATATLVASLAEMDARRLHLAEGCSSLFRYCTERLHLSEDAAYHRIEAARVARRFPITLEHLACGELSLTTIAMLGPHLTAGNHEWLLEAARGRSKREVEVLVRGIAPLPDVRASIRKVAGGAVLSAAAAAERACPRVADSAAGDPVAEPASSDDLAVFVDGADLRNPDLAVLSAAADSGLLAADDPPARSAIALDVVSATPTATPRRAEIRALSPASYSLRVTLSADAHAKLRKAQDLLRHQVPNGDPAVIVARALTLLVEQLERAKFAKRTERRPTVKPRKRLKHEPVAGSAKRSIVSPDPGTPEPAKSTKRPEPIPRAETRESGGHGREQQDRRPSQQVLPGRRPRGIPAHVRREVWERDQGRCAFVGTGGRCSETGMLEFHHRVPFADGGEATAANIEVRCTGHNRHEAEIWERGAAPWSTRSGPSSTKMRVLKTAVDGGAGVDARPVRNAAPAG
jgi:5-methylcytosine-specific restriction endonuclease McrA